MRVDDSDGETTLIMQRTGGPVRPSVARRFWNWIAGGVCDFVDSFRDPRLVDYLPPIPARLAREDTLVSPGSLAHAERCERLLLDVVRAPPEYLRGVAAVVEYAERWHELGPIALENGIVHLAISRISPDRHGEILICWIERKLEGVPSFIVTRALRCLARDGVIALLPAREGDVGTRLPDAQRGPLGRVQLQRSL